MQKPIKKIVIVGGGSSGWLSAAYLQRTFNRHDPNRVEICLIESPDIGIIGVGEATIPTLKTMLSYIGVDESEFLRRTNATLKQAIRFINWRKDPAIEPNYYYHPFDRPPVFDGLPAHHALSSILGESSPERFAYHLSLIPTMCDAGRSAKLLNDRPYQGSYAYHMDAVLMGRYLKEIAKERGVVHIEDKVERISRTDDGSIAALHTEAGRTISGDLFIDCSGFISLLLKGVFEEPFESYKDSLFCDRAVAIQVPADPDEPILPYTKSTAMSSGWIWEIQLQERRGIGYVYASDFISDDDAERELRNYIGAKAEGINARRLPMRVGRNQNFWVKNCVGIGLSGGFIEPLESTGIYLIEIGLISLVDNLPLDGIQESCIRNYNRCMRTYYDQIRDFIVLHYCLTEREDTEFWRANKFNPAVPESLKENLDLWKNRYPSPFDNVNIGNFFSYETYLYVMGGMGKLSGLKSSYNGYTNQERLKRDMESFAQRGEVLVHQALPHRDFLMKLLAKPMM